MKYRWLIGGPGSLAQDYGGSSQGRIAFLRDHLARVGRIDAFSQGDMDADISYAIDGAPEFLGRRLTVGQLVSLPSRTIGEGYYHNEAAVARRAASSCDLLVCNSALHLEAVVGTGVPREKLIAVQPGACVVPIADRRADRPQRPAVLGYAGMNRQNKRPWLASYAATMTGAHYTEAFCNHHSKMLEFYDGIALLVFPSVGDSWGMVISEAIARGVPVVCTDQVGAAAEVRQSGAGVVVEGLDEGRFLDACVDAWERRDKLTAAAWAYQPRTPTAWAEEVVELCERAAERAA